MKHRIQSRRFLCNKKHFPLHTDAPSLLRKTYLLRPHLVTLQSTRLLVRLTFGPDLLDARCARWCVSSVHERQTARLMNGREEEKKNIESPHCLWQWSLLWNIVREVKHMNWKLFIFGLDFSEFYAQVCRSPALPRTCLVQPGQWFRCLYNVMSGAAMALAWIAFQSHSDQWVNGEASRQQVRGTGHSTWNEITRSMCTPEMANANTMALNCPFSVECVCGPHHSVIIMEQWAFCVRNLSTPGHHRKYKWKSFLRSFSWRSRTQYCRLRRRPAGRRCPVRQSHQRHGEAEEKKNGKRNEWMEKIVSHYKRHTCTFHKMWYEWIFMRWEYLLDAIKYTRAPLRNT